MLIFNRALSEERESPALVVATTSLQLALVVLVWLLAIVPAAIAALTVMTIKILRGAFRKAIAAKTPAEGGEA